MASPKSKSKNDTAKLKVKYDGDDYYSSCGIILGVSGGIILIAICFVVIGIFIRKKKKATDYGCATTSTVSFVSMIPITIPITSPPSPTRS